MKACSCVVVYSIPGGLLARTFLGTLAILHHQRGEAIVTHLTKLGGAVRADD